MPMYHSEPNRSEPESDIVRARRAGLEAAKKQSIAIVKNPIEAPQYARFYSARRAELLTDAFWEGVSLWNED